MIFPARPVASARPSRAAVTLAHSPGNGPRPAAASIDVRYFCSYSVATHGLHESAADTGEAKETAIG